MTLETALRILDKLGAAHDPIYFSRRCDHCGKQVGDEVETTPASFIGTAGCDGDVDQPIHHIKFWGPSSSKKCNLKRSGTFRDMIIDRVKTA